MSPRKVEPPVSPEKGLTLERVMDRLEENDRQVDREWLRKIYDYSAEHHKGQTRSSGEPYIEHPLAVGWLLADLRFDATCVAVALLHDVLEDTGVSKDELAGAWGDEIAALVDGVSKIGKHAYVRRDEAQAETFRKLVLASARDIRVIVVKVADRLHNMQTLGPLRPDKRRRIARETLEIYAPIAHRLGMSGVRQQLEDLAFFHLYPHQYAQLAENLRRTVKVRKSATRKISTELTAALADAGLEAQISHRVKGYYSIYQKLRRQDIDISELYDYIAFRIIVDEVAQCYATLGVVHQKWRPIPGRFKDYIAVPKPNLYQSLHTTLVGEKGQPFEVQIRTHKMNLIAEEGIAAHWHYKEGRVDTKVSDPNILWLRQLLEWQQEVQDPRTFLNTLKIDLYPDEVYVFTPKGEVHSFPRGATPLDFAYRIHTDLGHQCAGARVNGRLVPLRTALSNGDIVEVMTNPGREPSRDWLNIVVTPRAKSKIRHWLNTRQKDRAIEIGKTVFEKEARKLKQSIRGLVEGDAMRDYLKDEGLASIEDLYGRIGFGRASIRTVFSRLLGEAEVEQAAEQPPGRLRQAVSRILPFGSDGHVTVRGHGDLLAYLAKCCSPLPGDDIVGYVTRGRGVAVHSAECPNVRNLLYHPEREIGVEWARRPEKDFQINLVISGTDSPGLLARITDLIARHKTNIRNIDARTDDNGRGIIEVAVVVADRRQLDQLAEGLRKLDGIRRVERRMSGSGRDGNASPRSRVNP